MLEHGDCVLLAVADGMGGHPRGEMAAQLIVDSCRSLFADGPCPVDDPRALLGGILLEAHERIVRFGLAKHPPIEPRSTAALALVQGGVVHWAHLGDSRFYLLRGGAPRWRSEDHSYVQELFCSGLIKAEERDSHPMRNVVTRSVGGLEGPSPPDFGGPERLIEGDLVLLCTDGLWGSIPSERLATALLAGPARLAQAVQGLALEAEQAAEPYSDNVTAVALRWNGRIAG